MASRVSRKSHGKSKYQQQRAINSTKIPKKPEEEVGKEIEMLGKDWNMTGMFLTRVFRCYCVRYIPTKKWPGKDIPDVSLPNLRML